MADYGPLRLVDHKIVEIASPCQFYEAWCGTLMAALCLQLSKEDAAKAVAESSGPPRNLRTFLQESRIRKR